MMDFTVHPDFLKEHGYCVYEHVFPNGKRYIGITKDIKKRWQSDGHGYDGVPTMRKAIEEVGWENIQHNIIVKYLPRQQARNLEKYLIEQCNAIEDGYNQRNGGELGASLYSPHVMKRLSQLRTCRIHGAKEFAEMMELFSENEAAAYTVNLIDYVLRTEVDAYKNALGDELMDMSAWVYYMKGGISGKDVREMPSPSEFICQQVSEIRSN